MKRVYLTVALTSALMLLLFGFLYSFGKTPATTKLLKIGFIYENDVSTPYTYNFSLAEDALLGYRSSGAGTGTKRMRHHLLQQLQ